MRILLSSLSFSVVGLLLMACHGTATASTVPSTGAFVSNTGQQHQLPRHINNCNLKNTFNSKFLSRKGPSFSSPWSIRSKVTKGNREKNGLVMYEGVGKNDENSGAGADSSDIVWTSLATTEKWIQQTLNMGETSGGNEPTPGGPRLPAKKAGDNNETINPYTRKEVQYECEESKSLAGVMAGIFARLRALREMGDEHCEEMQDIAASLEGIEKKSKKFQSTLRQTVVVVSPSCPTINASFDIFDALVQTINQSRREARDYVLDPIASKARTTAGDGDEEWVASLNLSHLHPLFYYEKPGTEVQDEDPKVQSYKEQRKKARQSPYPTLVLEVKASPPQPLSPPPSVASQDPLSQMSPEIRRAAQSPPGSSNVADEDLKKIEALFGKTAATSTADDNESSVERDAASEAVDKFTSTIFSPLGQCQNWATENDPTYPATHPERATFDICTATQVDAVCEFVFQYLAKQERLVPGSPAEPRQAYVLLPHFCSKSATSFEKFTIQLRILLALLQFDKSDEQDDTLTLSGSASALEGILVSDYFHPEHVDAEKRSPLPILSLRWGPVINDLEMQGAFQ
jgi:hypothetical protein